MKKGTHEKASVQPIKVDTKAPKPAGAGKVEFGYAGTARKGKKA
jgi:hypothetical protein